MSRLEPSRPTPRFPHREPTPLSRREMLGRSGAGFGALALLGLLAQEDDARATSTKDLGSNSHSNVDPLAPRAGHHPARAKSVIFLFMEGGPSHIDTFDPKPKLNDLAGQQLPESFEPIILAMGENHAPLMPSPRKWKRHGQSGLWVSDWLPHLAECVDDLTIVRSCQSDGINHSPAVCQMNTGSILAGRPSLGAWVTYGLGSENQNLPGFVVLTDDPPGRNGVTNGPRNWGTGFMPATFQGTALVPGAEPIPNLQPPEGVDRRRLRRELDLLGQINARHAEHRYRPDDLEARIRSYELAYRMQAVAPEAVDLAGESAETRALYGLDDEVTGTFGRNCLLARRLVERGVRFVQLYHGSGSKWDTHSGHEKRGTRLCREMDRPVSALLKDLKRRGLLDETLVVWGGEFGRTPQSEQGNGRDHNPYGFTMWMAGAGLAGGRTVGTTDEIGLHAVDHKLHVHDIHATILYLLGLDHMELTYYHKGRPERPTVNEGEPSPQILTMNS